MQNFENFSKVKILVIGDIMIDRFWWGKVSRISPEAPVPVVNLEKTTLAAGGAANVAANIAGLGAQPFLIGVVGDDDEAKLLPELLKCSNVGSENLIKIKNRPTTVKTRIIAHGQQIVRLDQETKEDLSADDEQKVWQIFEKLIKKTDLLVISDYAKGVLTKNLLSRLIKNANDLEKKVLVDPKGKNFNKYKNADLITPNRAEVLEAYKLEKYDRQAAEKLSGEIISELNLEAILITQGEDGMSLFEKNGQTNHLKSVARDVYDVTGAGDTVIGCLAVAIGSGMSFSEAAEFANSAAGLVVEHSGTTSINLQMFEQHHRNNGKQ